eukprot:gnl/Chilomastix_cuspidata/330.p1 GENE.gnl/Chilomastix_cuspidata/330~~gnl/Chilomastix_cuspidata/330.p1  ORF type:complete len:349 (+),score=94.55 gnl/Chilomastix_cuspidata/330:214-1260(+)
MHILQKDEQTIIIENPKEISEYWNLIISIIITIIPLVLYFTHFKKFKYYLIQSTLFVSAACLIDAIIYLFIYQINIEFAEDFGSDTSTVQAQCEAINVFSLIMEYYVCFWCASISIFFITMLHKISESKEKDILHFERRIFYVSNIISAALAVVFSLTIEFCGCIGFNMSVSSEQDADASTINYNAHCGITWDKNDPMRDSSIPADFVLFDIPSMLCALIAFCGIVFGLVVLVRGRLDPSRICPSKHYFFMFGLTLIIFIVMTMPQDILDFISMSDDTSISKFLSILLHISTIVSAILPLPIWAFTVYQHRRSHRNQNNPKLFPPASTSEDAFFTSESYADSAERLVR